MKRLAEIRPGNQNSKPCLLYALKAQQTLRAEKLQIFAQQANCPLRPFRTVQIVRNTRFKESNRAKVRTFSLLTLETIKKNSIHRNRYLFLTVALNPSSKFSSFSTKRPREFSNDC